MSDQPESAGHGTSAAADQRADQRVCKFPIGYDPETGEFEEAGHPLPPVEGRGRPVDYCGEQHVDPDGVLRVHSRANAFQRKRELKLEAAESGAPQHRRAAGRPVTSARATLADLLARWEMVTTAHRDQLTSIVEAAQQVVATAGDPDAAAAEVAAVRRDAKAEVDAATTRADEAEDDARTARRELSAALEDKALAEGAAEDAIADRDAKVAAAEADATAAQEEAAAARAEAERIRTEAEQQIAAAKQQARELVESVRAEAAAAIEAAETAAAEQIRAAEQARREAESAQHRAESAQAAAEQAATDARADADRVRGQLDRAVADARSQAEASRAEITTLREELASVRSEARADREQLRNDHASDITRVQAAADARVATLERALTTAEQTITRLQAQLTQSREGEK
ncbi:hypothetical protein [Nocardia africana]